MAPRVSAARSLEMDMLTKTIPRPARHDPSRVLARVCKVRRLQTVAT